MAEALDNSQGAWSMSEGVRILGRREAFLRENWIIILVGLFSLLIAVQELVASGIWGSLVFVAVAIIYVFVLRRSWIKISQAESSEQNRAVEILHRRETRRLLLDAQEHDFVLSFDSDEVTGLGLEGPLKGKLVLVLLEPTAALRIRDDVAGAEVTHQVFASVQDLRSILGDSKILWLGGTRTGEIVRQRLSP